MRCEIGWPIVMFMPGTAVRRRGPRRGTSLLRALLQLEAHVDLGGVDVLGVLVELGAAGAAGRRDDLGLRQQDLLDAPAERVGLGQRGPRQRHGADGQRALVELGQEGAAQEGHHRDGAGQQRDRRADDHARAPQGRAQRGRVGALERAHQAAVAVGRDRARRGTGTCTARASGSAPPPATRRSPPGRRSRAEPGGDPRRPRGRRAAGRPAR